MLSRLVPGPLVRFFARPYIAGSSIDDGLRTAERVHRDYGLLSTLDLLGEDVVETEQAERQVRTYHELLTRTAEDARFADAPRPTVSVKPSGFTTGDREAAKGPLFELARTAHDLGVQLTIDMEDRRWTDLTLAWSTELFQSGIEVGTVLQTRLDRTEADVETIPPGMRIRLVIGIYPEPAEVATIDKNEMKERMIQCARRLLERGCRVEFATHDELFLERFAKDVAPMAPDRVEAQMLLGVPRDDMQIRLQRGDFGVPLPVRLYVPFAVSWKDATAYLRRRMAESPSMIWLVLANLWHRSGRRRPAIGAPPVRPALPAPEERAH